MKILRIRLLSLLYIVALVGIDRLTKRLIEINIGLNDSVNLFKIGSTEILNFTYVRNTGAAFSILSGQRLFLILTTGLLITGALIFLLSDRIKGKLMLTAVTLIIAGGAGNLIDRVFYGYVVDFIHFKVINFAIFNFADICAVTGAFIGLFAAFRDEIADRKQKEHE